MASHSGGRHPRSFAFSKEKKPHNDADMLGWFPALTTRDGPPPHFGYGILMLPGAKPGLRLPPRRHRQRLQAEGQGEAGLPPQLFLPQWWKHRLAASKSYSFQLCLFDK